MNKPILTAAICAVVTTGSFASADTITLRYNRWLPSTHHADVRVLLPYFDEIEEVTEGRVVIEPTTSSLGSVERQYELAATGVADIALMSESLTPGQFPLAEIAEMPGLGTDTEAVSVAYWRVYEEFFAETEPYKATHLLTLCSLPPYQIYNAKREVAAIDDLDGLRLRAAGALSSRKVNALGATAVPAQMTQFIELISKGVVDGAYYTDDGVHAFGFIDFLDYKTAFPDGLGGYSLSLVINRAKWEQISPEDREAISAISGEVLARKLGASFQQSVETSQAAMADAGVTVTEADEAFVAAVKEAMAPIEADWIAKANEAGVDGAAALEMLRSEAAIEAGS